MCRSSLTWASVDSWGREHLFDSETCAALNLIFESGRVGKLDLPGRDSEVIVFPACKTRCRRDHVERFPGHSHRVIKKSARENAAYND
jgi:hypothetical protein